MPYNPQITDQSGMFLAQGRLAGGMAALGGISQGIQTYQKNRLQNQVLSNENDALIAGLQQLQQMGGGATMSNLAPAGMDKLIQKHLEGGGLNLSDSMKLNSMLNTTLKTAQVGQQMQAQQMQAQVNQQRLMNEIATGRQAQADVVGIGKVLQELSDQEMPLTQERFAAVAARSGISPGAIESLTQSLGRLAPKREALGSTTQQLAVKLRAAAEQQLGRPLTAQEDADIMIQAANATRAPGPAAPETTEQKLTAERASKSMEALEKSFDDAYSAEESASMVISAMNKGAKGGTFGPARTFISKIFDLDSATEQVLLQKGVAGLTAAQATRLARGLGAMSNADRDFFVSTAPEFTDPDQANRFYAEMVMENAKFARQDQDLKEQMEADGRSTKEIVTELQKRRRSRKVGAIVRDRVLGKAQPTQPAATGLSQETVNNYLK